MSCSTLRSSEVLSTCYVKALGRGAPSLKITKEMTFADVKRFIDGVLETRPNAAFTMALEYDKNHHMTIVFLGCMTVGDRLYNPKFNEAIENGHDFAQSMVLTGQVSVNVIGRAKFGPNNVALIRISDVKVARRAQEVSQLGLTEGKTSTRIHHVTIFNDQLLTIFATNNIEDMIVVMQKRAFFEDIYAKFPEPTPEDSALDAVVKHLTQS